MFGNETREAAARSGGGNFLRLDKPVEVALVGEEIHAITRFDELNKRYVRADKGGFRFAIQAWEPGRHELTVLEGPKRLASAIMRLIDSGVEMSRAVVKITKTGSGTSTDFDVVRVRDLDEADLLYLADLDPIDLLESVSWGKEPAPVDDSDVPF